MVPLAFGSSCEQTKSVKLPITCLVHEQQFGSGWCNDLWVSDEHTTGSYEKWVVFRRRILCVQTPAMVQPSICRSFFFNNFNVIYHDPTIMLSFGPQSGIPFWCSKHAHKSRLAVSKRCQAWRRTSLIIQLSNLKQCHAMASCHSCHSCPCSSMSLNSKCFVNVSMPTLLPFAA